MKPVAALLALVVVAIPARGHFIWLVAPADQDAEGPLMVFSDSLLPDKSVPITKIAQTKLFGVAGKGALVPIKTTQKKDAYQVSHDATGIVMIAGTCRYGVVAKGKGQPYLLMYYPKTAVRKGPDMDRATWMFAASPGRLPVEFVPLEKKPAFTVYWKGKPAANIDVVLLVPGEEKHIELKTDSQGEFALPSPKTEGVIGMRASMVENKAGKWEGKTYAEIRHYATFTFHVPKRFLDKLK
jgi:hypothetical protein